MKKNFANYSTELANQFFEQLTSFNKLAGKKSMSRNFIQKAIEKAKKEHATVQKECDFLEADDVKVKNRLTDARDRLHQTRKKLMSMYKGLNHMDLANADDAVFYDDDDEIGYVIKGKEYHLDVNDAGDITLTPMTKHRRGQKKTQTESEPNPENPEVDMNSISDDDLMEYLDNSASINE